MKRAAQIAALLLYAIALLSTSPLPSSITFAPASVSFSGGSSDTSSSDSPLEVDDDDDDQDEVVQSEAIYLHYTIEQAPLSVAAAEYPRSRSIEPQLRPPRSLRA